MEHEIVIPIPEEGRPTINQAKWVIQCLYEGWKREFSAAGMTEHLMGWSCGFFHDVGLVSFWNALTDFPQEKVTAPLQHLRDLGRGKVAKMRCVNGENKPYTHEWQCSLSETESDLREQWEKRHPNHKVLSVEFGVEL